MQSITRVALADIARTTPSSTRVFLRHHLDFCCGGRRTLAEACAYVGLDPDMVAAEVQAEARRRRLDIEWDLRSPTELCDYIEARFHAGLRRDIPSLIDAARKVERVHAENPAVPAGLAALLSEVFSEMEDHMTREERVLFPMIRCGVRGEAMYLPISTLESEHQTHGEAVRAIRALTDDLRIPDGACATWRALNMGLEAMEMDLRIHIHLENNILFPRTLIA